jgi:hypothetical protein
MYIAVFLSGLLVGFLIKDWVRRNEHLKITKQTVKTLLLVRTFLNFVKPITPEEFLKKAKLDHWGWA